MIDVDMARVDGTIGILVQGLLASGADEIVNGTIILADGFSLLPGLEARMQALKLKGLR